MFWKTFASQFREKYLEKGYNEEEIQELLNYCNRLYNRKLPMIIDITHLSLLLGYKINFLYAISNEKKLFYREFKIPKRESGKFRIINEPLPNLKEIQIWINTNILKKIENENSLITSYRTGKSVRDNAKFHRNQDMVLNVDIKDYFSNITKKKTFIFFINLGYSKSISGLLAELCTLDNKLPQGAPTSPLLSNLITKNIDKRLFSYCKQYKIRYSRYADDLTFSGTFNKNKILKFVKTVLKEEGFIINKNKIRLKKRHQRQEVTGITVNKVLQVSSLIRRRIRQEVYYIEKYGLESHLEKVGIKNTNYLERLIGIINYSLFINKSDEEMLNFKAILKRQRRNNIS